MTALSLQWFVTRPRRRATVIRDIVIRDSGTARRERRAYRDSFFADPAVVEDDSRRMRRHDAAAR
jgi:hypothetical protein